MTDLLAIIGSSAVLLSVFVYCIVVARRRRSQRKEQLAEFNRQAENLLRIIREAGPIEAGAIVASQISAGAIVAGRIGPNAVSFARDL